MKNNSLIEYNKLTKNPESGEWENAEWRDDYFGKHNYGVIFPSHPNVVFDPRDEELETDRRLDEIKEISKDKHIIPDDTSSTRLARPCKGCGWHQTIAGAVLNSREWKLWRKHASENMLYDIDECEIIDAMSDDHWNDFIKFIIQIDRDNWKQ